jgi:sugar (pentulose or hexulose) kinase
VTRLTGGITRTPVWAQVLADVLGVPLMALEASDSSATGAALVGLRALGLPSPAEAGLVPPGPVYTPGSDHAFYVGHHRAYDALRGAMRVQEQALGSAAAPETRPSTPGQTARTA